MPFAGARASTGRASGAGALLAGRRAQRLVDAVLPARAIGLEMLENLRVDAQRDEFACAGRRGQAKGALVDPLRLLGDLFEGGLCGAARIARTPGSLGRFHLSVLSGLQGS